MMDTSEMTLPGRAVHKSAPTRRNLAKYAAINGVANTIMIVTIVMTDGDQRAAWAEQFPAFVDAVAAKMPVIISIASSIGLMIAAFRKSSHQDRASD
jgi:hypothetical protein